MVAWFVVSLKLLHTMQVCGDTSFFFSCGKRTEGMAFSPALVVAVDCRDRSPRPSIGPHFIQRMQCNAVNLSFSRSQKFRFPCGDESSR
jgi:hypothetical protein